MSVDPGRVTDTAEAMELALAAGGGLGGTLSIKVDPASLLPLLTAQTDLIRDDIANIGVADNAAAFAQVRADIAAIPLDTLKTQIVSAIPAPVSLVQVNSKLDAIIVALDITPPVVIPPVNEQPIVITPL